MFVTSKSTVKDTKYEVDWGNGKSYRMLVEKHQMGFSVHHTVVYAGTRSLLEYKNHLEAAYVLSGYGIIETMDGEEEIIGEGDLYVLDKHDKHYLIAGREDLVILCIFNPPLKGTENHSLSDQESSGY